MARTKKVQSARKLQLFKYNPATDGEETFNIDKALNENWVKIEGECDRLDKEIIAVKGDLENVDVSWSGITGKPETFPPSTHSHDDKANKNNGTHTGITNLERLDVTLKQNKIGRHGGDVNEVWANSQKAKESANIITHDAGGDNWSGLISDAGGNLLFKGGTHGAPALRLNGAEFHVRADIINKRGHSLYGTSDVLADVSGTDVNSLVYPGAYKGSNMTNAPVFSHGWGYIEVLTHIPNSWVAQRATDLHDTSKIWMRGLYEGKWSAWKKIGGGVMKTTQITYITGARDQALTVIDKVSPNGGVVKLKSDFAYWNGGIIRVDGVVLYDGNIQQLRANTSDAFEIFYTNSIYVHCKAASGPWTMSVIVSENV